MERVKEVKVWWKNTGRGIFKMRDGRKFLADATFEAYVHEIPVAFRDTIKPLQPLSAAKELLVVNQPKYAIQKRGGNWYDIVDSKGKIVNTKALKRLEAEQMVKELEGEK